MKKNSFVYSLADTSKLISLTSTADIYTLDASHLKKNQLFDVIAIEYEGELDFSANTVTKNGKESFTLTPDNAIKYHSYSGHDYYSTKPTVIKMEWLNDDADDAMYKAVISYETTEQKEITLIVNGKENVLNLDDATKSNKAAISDIKLLSGKLNTIDLVLTDQSNPHKDLGIQSLEITLEKLH